MQPKKLGRMLAVVACVALVTAACGGSSKNSAAGKVKTLAAVSGFDPAKAEIRLGVISPLSGPVAVIGKPLTAGNEVFFKKINDQGGIGGKYKVVLDEQDSQYVPQNGVQTYNSIKGNVVMFAQLLGTPVTKAVLPLLKQDNIVAAPASLDADWVREPNLLAIGGPYQIQMINAASFLLNDDSSAFKGKKDSTAFCSMIQDDAYGAAGQQGIDFAAKDLGFTVKATAKYAAGNADFTPQIQQLKSANCQVVFLVSTPSDTGKALGKAAQLQFAPQWMGQSPSYIGALTAPASPLKDYLTAHFMIVSEGTEWGDPTVPGMKTMTDDLAKYAPQQAPDYYFSFGYIEASSVAQVLEKAVSLGDLSRAGIVNAMTKIDKLTFDGLSGDYKYGAAKDREPPRQSSIFKINPAKPIGIEKVKINFTSDSAKKFVFL
jgi:ABC-type branched-subunit amino acid transport system substrate-binding protein